ncbi:MAG: serine hydrolase [Lachnospiraceae bacterium]
MDSRLNLISRIEAELKSYNGCMGIYISDGKGTKIAIRDQEKFETASTIKMFILAALFAEVEKGNLSLHENLIYKEEHVVDGSGILKSLELGTALSVKNLATLMIIISDNIATNMIIQYVTVEKINQFILELGLLHTKLHNSINFERYEALGTTTPSEYGVLLEKLAAGTLVSQQASMQMMEICKMQHYNTMLTKQFPPYFMDSDNYEEEIISVASKSGSMDACRNDGGIIMTPYGYYVIVLLNKGFTDAMYYSEHPAIVFGSKISRLVFDQYLTLEGHLE